MATRIVFTGSHGDNVIAITVEEGIHQVQEAWTSAQGLPFKLTRRRGSKEVWINPTAVAYWIEAPSRSGTAGF